MHINITKLNITYIILFFLFLFFFSLRALIYLAEDLNAERLRDPCDIPCVMCDNPCGSRYRKWPHTLHNLKNKHNQSLVHKGSVVIHFHFRTD